MNNKSYLVISKIELIEKTDNLINKLMEIKDDPMGKGMIMEMERKKKTFSRGTFIRNDKSGFFFHTI